MAIPLNQESSWPAPTGDASEDYMRYLHFSEEENAFAVFDLHFPVILNGEVVLDDHRGVLVCWPPRGEG